MLEKRVEELVRVYEDLEKTIQNLKKSTLKLAESHSLASDGPQINIRKLIEQLSRSKKRIERKIGNKLLLKKQQLRKRVKSYL